MLDHPQGQLHPSRVRNADAVLEALRRHPRLTRAEMAAATSLSKPTVATALTALAAVGLIREWGRSSGHRGPTAAIYEPVAEAGFVTAIDIGLHHVRGMAADLEGQPVQETEEHVRGPEVANVLDAVASVHARLGGPNTILTVVGSPGIVDPETGRIRSAPQLPSWEGLRAESVLSRTIDHRVIVENDVNLAALGELAGGAGRGARAFAYLKVGSGLGCGLILGSRLHRGRHGAAGEVGFLAVGPDPLGQADRTRGPMERRLSASGVAASGVRAGFPPDVEPTEIFAAARAGDPAGRRAIAEVAESLAVCVASITAVLDLELVLLGGGIGAQIDELLEPTRAAVETMVPFAPRLAAGELADRATLVGAASVAAGAAREELIRRGLELARAPDP